MKKAGLIQYPSWGHFQITDEGRALLAESPAKIDLLLLKRYPSFLEFWSPAKAEEQRPAAANEELTPTHETPEELIASAFEALKQQVQAELLGKLIEGSPEFFERFVVRLLTTIGYGGSLADAGQAIGRSHDNGIDGVIKEDRLGLDLIYVQAKRWQNTTVGAPDVQGFVGALAGKKARKGVFLTTSRLPKKRAHTLHHWKIVSF